MPPENSFIEQLQSHIGGLVRLTIYMPALQLNGKIGLLVRFGGLTGAKPTTAAVEVLIDGSIHKLYAYLNEIELIGADDA